MSCLVNNRRHQMKCHFCGASHSCRNCPLEAEMAPFLKKKVGISMEHYVANNFYCPRCNNKTLSVIGNHSPSLDIICNECNKKIEVKSKCLSVNNLPNDIILPHGSYYDFVDRINQDLDIMVIIYGVDRIKKQIKIREVLHIPNNKINNKNIIQIEKRDDNNLSYIKVLDKHTLHSLLIPNKDRFYDFSQDFEIFKRELLSKNILQECF